MNKKLRDRPTSGKNIPMKKPITWIMLLFFCSAFYTSCKKSNGSSASPFAESLRTSCNTTFVGKGDSLNIYSPTAFTPNGSGTNNVYRLVADYNTFSSFLVTIYDTTGLLVYQSDQASFLWFGIDSTGIASTNYKFYVKINYTTTGNITDSGCTYLFLLGTDSAAGCVHAIPADSSKYEFPDQFSTSGFMKDWPSGEVYCN